MTAKRYVLVKGPRRTCAECRERGHVVIDGEVVCWSHYNDRIKEQT